MQLGLKNGDVSPPEELSLFHERSLTAFAFAAKGRCFFTLRIYIKARHYSKNTASHCSFYLFVVSRGECQWKNLRGDEAQRWPSNVTYIPWNRKNPPLSF